MTSDLATSLFGDLKMQDHVRYRKIDQKTHTRNFYHDVVPEDSEDSQKLVASPPFLLGPAPSSQENLRVPV